MQTTQQQGNVMGTTGTFFQFNYALIPPRVKAYLDDRQPKITLTPEELEEEEREYEEFKQQILSTPSFSSSYASPAPASTQNQPFQPSNQPMLFNTAPVNENASKVDEQREYEIYQEYLTYKNFVSQQKEQEDIETRHMKLHDTEERLRFTLDVYGKCFTRCVNRSHHLNVTSYVNKLLEDKETSPLSESETQCLSECAQSEYNYHTVMRDAFVKAFLRNTDTGAFTEQALAMYNLVKGNNSASTSNQPQPQQQPEQNLSTNMFGGLNRQAATRQV